MPIFPFVLLLISAVAAQERHSNISLGSSLTPITNSSWLSPSGLYAFGFVPQSNAYVVAIFLAGIPEKTVVWTANRDDNPRVSNNVVLQLTLDGRLILQQIERQVTADVVDSSLPIAWASMLENGNFVLYDSNSRIIWQSFDHPTDTLLTGQHLPPGGELFSRASKSDLSRGIFRLKMQTDGNLVQYPVNTPNTRPYAYYATNTARAGNNISLNLEKDGYLYLFNGSSVLKNLTTGGYPVARTIHLMRIDVDGIFRLYSHTLNGGGKWTITWQPTNDVCTPKGLCGVNSFCVLMDDVAACRCLPGFDFVESGNWTAGCTRNFTAQVCGSKDLKAKFEIRVVVSTTWEDNSYDGLDTITQEECKRACLEDCNCEVAFFNVHRCLKQRLPLRFGSRRLSESNVALVKVSICSSVTPGVSFNLGKKEKAVNLDILIISISLLALAFSVFVFSWIYVRRKRALFKIYNRIPEVMLVEDVGLRAFTYADLAKATNDFQEELGRGASGIVYRGVLENSQEVVAVKRLEKEFAEGEREFQTEVKTIGKTYHRNLVQLVGYCVNGPSRLLVFEYMSNGSLADVLFTPDMHLIWEERIELARDIARGILYLHEECKTQIIHCDIKPQNILMDEKGCAKISDFGIAKLLKQDQTKTYTGVRGTKGYLAPEWHKKQPVTVKADVYSFGIVLLEIICCRKSVDWNLSDEEAILDEWVFNCYEAGEMEKLVGNETVDKRKLERMVKIGIWCIQDDPSLRPSMKKVLLMLEGTVEIPVPPNPTSFLSSV